MTDDLIARLRAGLEGVKDETPIMLNAGQARALLYRLEAAEAELARLRVVDAESVSAHVWQKEKAKAEKFKDQVIDTCKRAEKAEAELARLRAPVTDKELIEQAVQVALDVGVAVNGDHGVAAARVAARHVVARLRAPVEGEVGEMVKRLDALYWADKVENLACLEARDLLTRQAARLREAEEVIREIAEFEAAEPWRITAKWMQDRARAFLNCETNHDQ